MTVAATEFLGCCGRLIHSSATTRLRSTTRPQNRLPVRGCGILIPSWFCHSYSFLLYYSRVEWRHILINFPYYRYYNYKRK